jgi:hypothetical protein
MKEQNLILLIALVVANLMSDRIKPFVDNMLGKLVLVLTVCYLANKHIILGLLGVLLYTSVYNGLLEGMEEENEDEIIEEGMNAEGEEIKDEEGEEIKDEEGMVGREGEEEEEDPDEGAR